jgi:VPDSG-CTERM motif
MGITGVPRKLQGRTGLATTVSLLLLLASPALAVPKHYQLGSGSVTAQSSEPGLVIDTMVKPSLPGTEFTIDNGQSFTVSFFDIWTNEPTINADDTVSHAISATLNFVDPFTGATINGITVGGSWFKGLSQWGQVTWNGPVDVNLPGDRVFEITLSDATFNYGFGGLNEGMMCGATVDATIMQISSENTDLGRSVPDSGSTAMLLGVALCGVVLIARHRVRC